MKASRTPRDDIDAYRSGRANVTPPPARTARISIAGRVCERAAEEVSLLQADRRRYRSTLEALVSSSIHKGHDSPLPRQTRRSLEILHAPELGFERGVPIGAVEARGCLTLVRGNSGKPRPVRPPRCCGRTVTSPFQRLRSYYAAVLIVPWRQRLPRGPILPAIPEKVPRIRE
jgi:hypothetical protein